MTFSYARPVRSRKVVAVYLCAVGFQLVHMAEEYTGAFPHEIVELFDSPRDWPEREFLLVFVFGFGALCFFAGAGALYFLIKGERRLEAAEQEEQVRLPVAYARQPGDQTRRMPPQARLARRDRPPMRPVAPQPTGNHANIC